MKINLTSIEMKKGKQYETIISSSNLDNVKNAAPIGVICSGEDTVICRIFKGSTTLKNILLKKEFIINITHDSELFLKSTVGKLDDEYFNNDCSIKYADAYAKCNVISFKEAIKQSDPIKKNGEAIVIKSKVSELKINKNVKTFNRGFGYVIESLINFSRFDLLNDNEKEESLDKFREAKRIITKVGYNKDIEAINKIKEELIKKGYDL